MQEGHRVRHHAPPARFEPATLHEVEPFAEPAHQPGDLAEVVAVVGVAHDDVRAARRLDAAHQRAAVAPFGYRHNSGTHCLRDLLRTVGAAVVGDDHFAADASAFERALRLGETTREGVGFVETRHHDRHFHLALVRRRREHAGPAGAGVARLDQFGRGKGRHG